MRPNDSPLQHPFHLWPSVLSDPLLFSVIFNLYSTLCSSLSYSLPYSYPLATINHCTYIAMKYLTLKELFLYHYFPLSPLLLMLLSLSTPPSIPLHHQLNNSLFSLLYFKLYNHLCISFYLYSLFQVSSNLLQFYYGMHSMHWSSGVNLVFKLQSIPESRSFILL